MPGDPIDPFICPRCGNESEEFHDIYPECSRPLMRDYIEWRMYPRDPDMQGTLYYIPFRARVGLVL